MQVRPDDREHPEHVTAGFPEQANEHGVGFGDADVVRVSCRHCVKARRHGRVIRGRNVGGPYGVFLQDALRILGGSDSRRKERDEEDQ